MTDGNRLDNDAHRKAAAYARQPSIWAAPAKPPPAEPIAKRMVAVTRTVLGVITLSVVPPLILWVIFGNPVDLLPSWNTIGDFLGDDRAQPPRDLVVPVITAALWFLWAAMMLLLLGSLLSVVAGIRMPHWRLPAPLHRILFGLAGSAAVTLVTTPHAAPVSTVEAPATSAVPEVNQPGHTGLQPGTVTLLVGDARYEYEVKRGDTLSKIARRWLGDPDRWPEICRLNRHRHVADGARLTDCDLIYPGWQLRLPPDARPPATTPPEHPPQHDTHPPRKPATPPTSSARQDGTASSSTAPTTTGPGPRTTAPTDEPTAPRTQAPGADRDDGVTLPSHGWISLGLATTIAALAALLRLNQRRRASLARPIPVTTGPAQTPIPPELAVADAAGRRTLEPDIDPNDEEQTRPGVRPAPPELPAPIGVTATGAQVSLFDLPGPGVTLHGPGAEPVARAVIASALATGVLEHPVARPIVVTTAELLHRLLPDGVEVTGLDPHHSTFDGERLLLLEDSGAAVTHAEEELIGRRRLLDTFDATSIAELNTRGDHAEAQPPYVLLIDPAHREAGRIAAIAAHRHTVHLHTVVLGELDSIPGLTIAADGTVTAADHAEQILGGRLSTLAASDFAHLLAMIADAAARPEQGHDIDNPIRTDDADRGETPGLYGEPISDLPARTVAHPHVQLSVLGQVTVTTASGPITTGMRTGSYAVLALLAAHPHGRTLDQIAADLLPDTDPAVAVKRLRTDINTARRVLRAATGPAKPMFIIHDPATSRYRLDPDLIEVDLWRMLTAIHQANTATDDIQALAALHEAADLYAGDFAEGQDRAWITDYATTYRHQILGVYTRIAEILEPDQPDTAVTTLEQAIQHDPVNEELYQRVMRIHGRQRRPDAVRRTLHRLENQLAELGVAEPSEATRRVAARQLHPTPSPTASLPQRTRTPG